MTVADRLAAFGRWLGSGVRLAAARFPAAALAILAVSILCNLAVQDATGIDEVTLGWLVAALASGGAVSVGAALVAESRGLSWGARQGLSVAAGVLTGLLVWFGDGLGLFAPAFICGMVLLVPLAPFARGAGRSDIAFWSFTLWALIGAALAFLSVLLFLLGVSAILEMVRFLLEVGLSSDAYEHIFVTAFTLVGPLFALGQVPRLEEHADIVPSDDRLLVGVRVLFDWVAAPLALATALVLHLYAAKIALQGALPVGEIGWIVTFYAILLLALRMAIAPYVPFGAWPTRLLARAWWALLLVPLALLALAVTLRVSAEGWTSERYYLALGGFAAGLAVLIQIVPRLRGSIVALGLVPAVLLVLSSFGPWGVEGVVARSQGGIVAERFAENGRIRAADRLSPQEASELRSRLYALDEVGGLDALAPLAGSPDVATALERSSWTGEDDALDVLLANLGLGYGSAPAEAPVLSFAASAPASIDAAGFDRVAVSRMAAIGDPEPATAGTAPPAVPRLDDVLLVVRGTELEVAVGGASRRFDLGPALRGLPAVVFTTEPMALPPPVVDLTDREGRIHVRLAIELLLMPDDRGAVRQLSATVLYRAAEWGL